MVWGIPSRLGPCVSTQDIVRSPFGPSAIGKFLNFRVPAYLAGGLSYSAGLIGNHAMHSVESQSSQKSAKVILAGQEQTGTSSASERRRIGTTKPARVT